MVQKSDQILTFGRTKVDLKHMADVLKFRRTKLGMSQRDLADRSAVSTTTIFNMEQGTCKVQLDIFLQVLAALDLIPQQVLYIDSKITEVAPTENELELLDAIRTRDFPRLLTHIATLVGDEG